MSPLFLASYLLLWVLVAILTLWLIGVSRQFGGFSKGVQGLPMADHGLAPGQPFPLLEWQPVNGPWRPRAASERRGIVVLIASTTCKACKGLYPVINAFKAKSPDIDLGLLVTGAEQDVAALALNYELQVPVSALLSEQRELLQTTIAPFGYFLSPEGVVLDKGVVNSAESLEYLAKTGLRAASARRSAAVPRQENKGA